MFILSPKSSFLGGALVSASHLGKLFPGKLLVWDKKSEFLDNNGVYYRIVNKDSMPMTGESIWVNDICVDEGYYPKYEMENKDLWKALIHFKNIHLVNHQPISRVRNYLFSMLSYLTNHRVNKIYLYNYRNCWNEEFKSEFSGVFFSKVDVRQLPYHYYLDYIPKDISYKDNYIPMTNDGTTVSIGRSNSKCKIQSKLDIIKDYIILDTIYPNINVTNTELLHTLNNYKYTLTGYYYGGEGNPEIPTIYNHLEWGFMDALLAWSIPLTSSLFKLELERLNIPAPILDYKYKDLIDIHNILRLSQLNDLEILKQSRNTLIKELEFGNMMLSHIIERF